MKFEGRWKYQSYRPDPGSVATDPNPPTFVPWSPPGVVTVDQGGTTGTLEFTGTPIKLDLKFVVMDGTPAGLSASAVMKLPGGKQFTNELHGHFVPAELGQEAGKDNPLVVRGSIVQTSADIAPTVPQPMFTTGVLRPGAVAVIDSASDSEKVAGWATWRRARILVC
ncbi:hypothetical protein [Luteitalea pratensis]|uniref:hypothetical protein n=1 Tax=Luteitalea pratensis TaxID=1855912 RepID=UPI0012FF92DE|nr:hypothetical protein [Luteitalea pratensis]